MVGIRWKREEDGFDGNVWREGAASTLLAIPPLVQPVI